MKRTDRTNWLALTAAIGAAPMAGAVLARVAAVAMGANQQAAHVTATSNARKRYALHIVESIAAQNIANQWSRVRGMT